MRWCARRTVGALFGRDCFDSMVTVLPQPDQLARAQLEVPNGETLGDLLHAHRQVAYNLAFRLLRRQEDAADAVQDAYVLAVQAMSRDTAAPREQGRFAPWLLKIVANVALGKLRRRSGSLTSLEELPQEPPDGHGDQPHRAVERREQRKDVLYALLTLPDAQRAALTLREYQGLNYDQIGDLLGLNRAATATLLYRARTSFREAYEGVVERAESLSCPELAPMVSAMLDRELEPDAWAFVQRHVDRCRRCQADLRQLRRSRRLYRAVPLLLPPAGWSWTSTLEAASAVGAVGAVRLAMSPGGLAPAVVAPAVVGSSAALAGPSVVGPLASIGGIVAGKIASAAVAVGLGLAVVVAPISDNRSVSPAPATEAVQAAVTMPVTLDEPAEPISVEPPAIIGSSLPEAVDQSVPTDASSSTASVLRALLVPADASDRVSTVASAAPKLQASSTSSYPPSRPEREAHDDADHAIPSGDPPSSAPMPSVVPVAEDPEPEPERVPTQSRNRLPYRWLDRPSRLRDFYLQQSSDQQCSHRRSICPRWSCLLSIHLQRA